MLQNLLFSGIAQFLISFATFVILPESSTNTTKQPIPLKKTYFKVNIHKEDEINEVWLTIPLIETAQTATQKATHKVNVAQNVLQKVPQCPSKYKTI